VQEQRTGTCINISVLEAVAVQVIHSLQELMENISLCQQALSNPSSAD
jgi:hypothetical protein